MILVAILDKVNTQSSNLRSEGTKLSVAGFCEVSQRRRKSFVLIQTEMGVKAEAEEKEE